jgi:hypothetical protein
MKLFWYYVLITSYQNKAKTFSQEKLQSSNHQGHPTVRQKE